MNILLSILKLYFDCYFLILYRCGHRHRHLRLRREFGGLKIDSQRRAS